MNFEQFNTLLTNSKTHLDLANGHLGSIRNAVSLSVICKKLTTCRSGLQFLLLVIAEDRNIFRASLEATNRLWYTDIPRNEGANNIRTTASGMIGNIKLLLDLLLGLDGNTFFEVSTSDDGFALQVTRGCLEKMMREVPTQ
uniref:PCNA_N domain-containing protein n=1 Tax=Meloidogyne hapla TaxID=6305 RepID=A0A1I8C0Q6_MELHA